MKTISATYFNDYERVQDKIANMGFKTILNPVYSNQFHGMKISVDVHGNKEERIIRNIFENNR